MLNKDYFASKELVKKRINGKVYFRVYHHLSGLITDVTVFELEKNSKTKELYLTEVSFDSVPEDVKEQIVRNEDLMDVTNDDKSLVIESLNTKYKVYKDIAERKLNVGTQRKLMTFIEVGGHYFGYIYEQDMPYTKLYYLNIEPTQDELYVGQVPPEMLPALFEMLSPIILKNASNMTIQVGEGVYARLSLVSEEKALVTTVVASEDSTGNSKLEVSMGFTLMKYNDERWLATVVREEEKDWIEQEMEKSFEIVYQELLIKVFEQKGNEALKGIN